MADTEHVRIVNQGAAAIAAWRKENPSMYLQLSGVELSGMDLTGAAFGGADLTGADLSDADLTSAKLAGCYIMFANLTRTNFTGADLTRADFTCAQLSQANFTRADLTRADFSGANLTGANLAHSNATFSILARAKVAGANFAGAEFGYTAFADLDFSSVEGLEKAEHVAPSTIGIDSMHRSKGKIPGTFLRGCGVPDGLVENLPSLMNSQEAIQFYSCFISYSHKDEEFCQHLHSWMRNEHLRVWFAPKDMKAGHKIHEQIDKAIRVYDKLLLVLSEDSMESEWVKTEIRRARRRERKEGERVLFPIRLVPFERIKEWEAFDADTGKDMAEELREYHIPDFANWKSHDAFEKAFKRLLSDLRASE